MSLSSDSEIKLYLTQFTSMVNSVIINQKWNNNNNYIFLTNRHSTYPKLNIKQTKRTHIVEDDNE